MKMISGSFEKYILAAKTSPVLWWETLNTPPCMPYSKIDKMTN